MRRKVGIDLAPASHGAPGTARHVTEQARALFRLDLPWDWVPTVESTQNPLWAEVQHLHPLHVPGRKFWTRATFQMGSAWKRADCSVGFSTAYFAPLPSMPSLPVVTNFFDSNIYEHFQTWVDSGRVWNARLIRLLSTYAIHRSDFLLVNSQYCADYLSRRFPSQAGKFVVTPPGITPPKPAPAATPSWAASLRKPFFLYVGIFSENKNQRRLIEAWTAARRQAPDLPHLVLVGGCDPDFLRDLIQPALKASPFRDEILLTGRVQDSELAWAYHHALAYVQPSIAEGFGLPVLEAMSYGLPVACSHTTSLPETAGGAALLFNPFELSSLQDALLALARQPATRLQLQESGRARWPLFSWEKNATCVAAQIEAVLRRL